MSKATTLYTPKTYHCKMQHLTNILTIFQFKSKGLLLPKMRILSNLFYCGRFPISSCWFQQGISKILSWNYFFKPILSRWLVYWRSTATLSWEEMKLLSISNCFLLRNPKLGIVLSGAVNGFDPGEVGGGGDR